MLTCDQGMLTSATLKDIRRSHIFGMCVFLDSTMIQCNRAHVFLDYYTEAEDNVRQIPKERVAARAWQL